MVIRDIAVKIEVELDEASCALDPPATEFASQHRM